MRIRNKKRITKVAALLVCFALIGVSSAQLLSNYAYISLTVSDPEWTLAFVGQAPVSQNTVEPPQSFTLSITSPISVGTQSGSLIFTCTSGNGENVVIWWEGEAYDSLPGYVAGDRDLSTGTFSITFIILEGFNSVSYDFTLDIDAVGDYEISIIVDSMPT